MLKGCSFCKASNPKYFPSGDHMKLTLPRTIRITYEGLAHMDMAINFCPFCGSELEGAIRERVMFRALAETGNIVALLLDSIKFKAGREVVTTLAENESKPRATEYGELIEKTRGLTGKKENEGAEQLLARLELESGKKFNVVKNRKNER